jgi:hypothetical protein
MILPYLAIVFLALVTVYSAIVSFRQTEDAAASWIFPTAPGRSAQIVAGILCLILLISLALWLSLGLRNNSTRSARFLLPTAYTGWIRIEFEVQGASPLPKEGGEYILRIPADGVLRTSSPEQYGWAQDHFYYYSADGMRPIPDSGEASLIWGRINGEASGTSGKRKYEEFFVGTAQQFKKQNTE